MNRLKILELIITRKSLDPYSTDIMAEVYTGAGKPRRCMRIYGVCTINENTILLHCRVSLHSWIVWKPEITRYGISQSAILINTEKVDTLCSPASLNQSFIKVWYIIVTSGLIIKDKFIYLKFTSWIHKASAIEINWTEWSGEKIKAQRFVSICPFPSETGSRRKSI